MAESEQADLTTLTVELLSAFVSNNTIESSDLAGLIQSTHAALAAIEAPAPVEPPEPKFEPAVSVRKSLGSRDHILSLIDGKPYKTLKRHLSGHGLTPVEYRERYQLPANYPLVAPAYSEHRRDVAQRLGLGRKSVKTAEPEGASAAAPQDIAVEPAAPVAPKVKAARKVAADPAVKTLPTAAEPSKSSAKRAAKGAAPPVIVASSDPVEAASATSVVEPKLTRKAAAPKAATVKAKRGSQAKPETQPKAAPAKRSRPKAVVTPAPTE